MNNDTNSTKSAGAKPSLLTRPTLSKQNADANDGWEDSRILSNSKMGPLGKTPPKKRLSPAENRAKAQAQSSGFGWKTVLAVGLVCVGSYVAYQYVLEVQYNARVARANANAAASAAAALAAAQAQATQAAIAQPTDAAPVVMADAEPAAGQAAQIVNEPTPPASAPAATPTPLTTALENGVKPPPDTLQKALLPSTAAATPVSAQAAATQPKEKTAAEKAADTRTAKAAAADAQAQAKAQAAAQTKSLGAPAKAPTTATVTTPTTPPAVAAEKDVNLLAALVTHNSLNAPKPTTAAAPSATAPADAAQRVSEESAESLLKRCAALESERQSACRAKACTGTRATEPACKTITAASLAPAAPTPAPAAAPTATPAPTPAPAAQLAPTLPATPALPTLPALPAIPLLAPAP